MMAFDFGFAGSDCLSRSFIEICMLAIREMAAESAKYLGGHAGMGKLTGTIDRRVSTSFFKEVTLFGRSPRRDLERVDGRAKAKNMMSRGIPELPRSQPFS
jgi:hypothetical protein